MADSKITGLAALTTADPANDMLPIVDVSDNSMAASGTTKRISINNILACSPSATLASATISGDLTVDTSTLKVDSANNWVGFGTATPAVRVHSSVADAAEAARFSSASAMLRVHPYLDATDKTRIQATNGTNTGLSDLTLEGFNLRFNTNGGLAYTISNVGVSTWSNVGGVAGTAMTLNSTGLGVGVGPVTSHILSCAGPIGISGTNLGTRTSYITNSGVCSIYYTDGGGSGYFTDFGNLIIQPRTSAARSVVIATGSTTPVERAVVKSTGQVRFVPLAADPAGAEAGDVYYNSSSNKLKCYNGTTWNDLF